MYDIIIVGGGPAGLTAALYARRADKSVLVIEKDTFGGQITYSPKVENYPGFAVMSGNEFAELLLDQVLAQGAEIELAKVTGIKKDGHFTVTTEDGSFESKTVIVAVGVKHRMLGVEGEGELVGHGILFCAVCDGAFYKGLDVAVIGGGNSALQEALLLSETSKSVTVVQNLDYLTGEARLQAALNDKKNVRVITGSVVKSFKKANGALSGLVISGKDGDAELSAAGVFIAVGLIPENDIFADFGDLNDYGYFDSDESCLTKTEGLFVAGDCRSKRIRQITTASADGAVAALAACAYIDNR
ncbi:MAG: NAD(P)/FAD-dependent oxidoreductase [Clostridia bacterium]|nr:NAD(P)/FAD-dependent oxidoreductase [Clostridia bacterium]